MTEASSGSMKTFLQKVGIGASPPFLSVSLSTKPAPTSPISGHSLTFYDRQGQERQRLGEGPEITP